jgi:hypothetical protein
MDGLPGLQMRPGVGGIWLFLCAWGTLQGSFGLGRYLRRRQRLVRGKACQGVSWVHGAPNLGCGSVLEANQSQPSQPTT